MDEKLPDPLVESNVDLKNFQYTPIFRARLFGSGFHAKSTDSEWRAGVTLWLKSWDQVPAGTLPDDDIDLCRLAEFGRDIKTWRKVKTRALHGWHLCSDGRLHHPVVAQTVMEAWEKQSRAKRKGKAGAIARWANSNSTSNSTSNSASNSTSNARASIFYGNRKERKGKEEKGRENIPPPTSSPKPEAQGVALPPGVSEEIWQAFVEHRRRLRKPMTDRAAKLIISKAIALSQSTSQNPSVIIEQSIERGWAGVFPIDDMKGNYHGKSDPIAATTRLMESAMAEEELDARVTQPSGGDVWAPLPGAE